MLSETREILVIGGGIAGIQASLDLADRGLKVYLVEKLEHLIRRRTDGIPVTRSIQAAATVLISKMRLVKFLKMRPKLLKLTRRPLLE